MKKHAKEPLMLYCKYKGIFGEDSVKTDWTNNSHNLIGVIKVMLYNPVLWKHKYPKHGKFTKIEFLS